MVAGTMLLAACGPTLTPTPTTGTGSTTSTELPSAGSTPTDVRGVVTTPTLSTQGTLVGSPGPDETSTPFLETPDIAGTMGTEATGTPAMNGDETPGMMETGTPGMSESETPEAMGTMGTDETPEAGMGETPEAMMTPGMEVEGPTYNVIMDAQNGSGQSGKATLTDMGNGMVHVVLDITGPGTTDPQPAHVHQGTCAQLDPSPAYPLSNVVDGKSVTDIEADFDTLTATAFAINVHKSAAEATVYVSCGDITTKDMSTPGATMQETPGATMGETTTP